MMPNERLVEGEVPDPREKPSGCAFRSRCPKEFGECSKQEPEMYTVGSDHVSRCFLHDEAKAPQSD